MVYLKLFETEQERQACEETQDYVSYTEDTDKVNIHQEEGPFLCKLTLDNGQVVKIEGSGEIPGGMLFDYSATTVSAEIGTLCTSLGQGAFFQFHSMTSVTIPNSVITIGETVFYGCNSLLSVNIPDSVTSIGESAFIYCQHLSSVTIGNSVTSIGNNAFYNCYALSSITIPNSVTSIDYEAFKTCSGLTSVIIGSGVTSIGGAAFQDCQSLVNITSLATTAPQILDYTFQMVATNGTLYVPQGSSGYDTWMQNANYYLGLYGWTKVEQ